MDTSDLQAQIDDLKLQIKLLQQASTIPIAIDYAWQGRGFLKTSQPGYPGNNTDFLSNEGFNSTGDPITPVLPYPIRWLQVQNQGGSNMYIPLFTYAELG